VECFPWLGPGTCSRTALATRSQVVPYFAAGRIPWSAQKSSRPQADSPASSTSSRRHRAARSVRSDRRPEGLSEGDRPYCVPQRTRAPSGSLQCAGRTALQVRAAGIPPAGSSGRYPSVVPRNTRLELSSDQTDHRLRNSFAPPKNRKTTH
jgi:hypothetical protein